MRAFVLEDYPRQIRNNIPTVMSPTWNHPPPEHRRPSPGRPNQAFPRCRSDPGPFPSVVRRYITSPHGIDFTLAPGGPETISCPASGLKSNCDRTDRSPPTPCPLLSKQVASTSHRFAVPPTTTPTRAATTPRGAERSRLSGTYQGCVVRAISVHTSSM